MVAALRLAASFLPSPATVPWGVLGGASPTLCSTLGGRILGGTLASGGGVHRGCALWHLKSHGGSCYRKLFFRMRGSTAPPITVKSVLVPGVVSGVVPTERVLPLRDVASTAGVAVALGVSLLLAPRQVVGKQGFLG